MADRSYRRPGLVLARGGGRATAKQVRDLQRDLRALGYLGSGIDGKFGPGTEAAVRAIERDLIENDGSAAEGESRAPVAVRDYNRGRVSEVSGRVDEARAACIGDMLDDPDFVELPAAADPRGENRRIAGEIAGIRSTRAPVPFLAAIFEQESGMRHFHEPTARDEDRFIVVGLDRNDEKAPERITSRGYGVGQYTLFHHPPRTEEVQDFMLDVRKNIEKAVEELRGKYDGFVVGPSFRTKADDRIAEHGTVPLRLCKFAKDDPRHLRDCRQCALDAGTTDIVVGKTPHFKGSLGRYQKTRYYKKDRYEDVPVRGRIECDWPYAVRRYNGSGPNSYHYQTRVLLRLAGREV